MRQHLNNPWVVLGLCVIAVLVMYLNGEDLTGSSVTRAPLTPKPLPVAPLTPLAKATSEPLATASPSEELQMDWPNTVNRDPFAPVVSAKYVSDRRAIEGDESSGDFGLPDGVEVQPPVFELSAVSLDPKPNKAMVNRKIVEEGDRIEGFRVSRIESDGVWFKGPTGPYHLTFHVDENKRSVAENREEPVVRRGVPSEKDRRSRAES